jgi:hypothetical protein
MLGRALIGAATIAATLCLAIPTALAFDESKYPDWRGQWSRVPVVGLSRNPSWDPHKSEGLAQQAPLTPEYQTILESSLADQAAGGAGLDRDLTCITAGMPRMMNVYSTMQIVVMPDTTFLLMGTFNDLRRIFTDGRDWTEKIAPSYAGYSIGRWIEEDQDGKYNALEVETRGFRGLRTLDSTAIPLHSDNQTIVKERLYGDQENRNVLHDEITIIDHALTRPWSVVKDYRRSRQARPVWPENTCIETNQHVFLRGEHYMLSADGLLMPSKKGQAPPDLRYFNQK